VVKSITVDYQEQVGLQNIEEYKQNISSNAGRVVPLRKECVKRNEY
jgi:hypothetical protein